MKHRSMILYGILMAAILCMAGAPSVRAQMPGDTSTLAGDGNQGFADGPGTSARFNTPTGVAVDASGVVYVADTLNNRIRKIDLSGEVTTLAGDGTFGFVNGPGASARFNTPTGVAVDASGVVYVADTLNNRIRKIDLSGDVTTLAGDGTAGFADGPGAAARFSSPISVAVDAFGVVYVADRDNRRIRKIDLSGDVTTLAGDGNQGVADGPGATAQFNFPEGVAVDASGIVYVADSGNNRIRKIDPSGNVTTLAGDGNQGFADGPGATAQFNFPEGVAVDASGVVYVADRDNRRIRKIDLSGEVTTLAGDGNQGFADGPGTTAQFSGPAGVAVDASGVVYVADTGNSRIRRVVGGAPQQQFPPPQTQQGDNYTVITLAGKGPAGLVNGSLSEARFNTPIGVVPDGQGSVYITEEGNHTIRRITPLGFVVTVAGDGTPGFLDGTGAAARFNEPSGITMDGEGNLFVADSFNHSIRQITPEGVVTTVAGDGIEGFLNGPCSVARFSLPAGIVVDDNGDLFVTEEGNHVVRKVVPGGPVTTLAGDGTVGFVDGPGTVAQFYDPADIVMDTFGNFFVADGHNNAIRKVAPDGTVTTLAGTPTPGFTDDVGSAARFSMPMGLAIDPSGMLYVTEEGNHAVRQVTPEGAVTTVAGNGQPGFADGLGVDARFNAPADIALTRGGGLILADSGNNRIRAISPIRRIHARLLVTARVLLPLVGERTITSEIVADNLDLGVINRLETVDLSMVPNGDLLAPFVSQLSDLSFFLPPEAIDDDDITLTIELRNIDATDVNNLRVDPVIVDGEPVPVFFLIRLSVEKNGVVLDRFDFNEGHPLTLRVPLGALQALIRASGFQDVPLEDLTLAFLTDRGFSREGILSTFDPSGNQLVIRVPHLSDLAGIRIADLAPPAPAAIVRGPDVDADSTFAEVEWRTSQPTDTKLFFGTAKAALNDSVSVAGDSLGVTDHRAEITGLTKSTQYFFRIKATDLFGRMFFSAVDSFRTRGIADLAAPVIALGPFVEELQPDRATVRWETDRRSTSTVTFDTTASLATAATLADNDPERRHRIRLTGLSAGKKYYYLVSSTGGGGTVVSDTLMFTTPSVLDTRPPVLIRRPRVDDFAVTDTTALITARTNVATTFEVFYWVAGTTDTLHAFVPEPTTEHEIVLTRLPSDTRFRYFGRFRRTENNRFIDSRERGFRTRRPGRVEPLRFTAFPHVVRREDRRVFLRWETNLRSNSTVYYQPDPNNAGVIDFDRAFVRRDPRLRREHRLVAGGLAPNTPYLFAVASEAPNGQLLVWPPSLADQIAPKQLVRGPDGTLTITGIAQVPGSGGRFTTNTGPDTQAPVILSGPTVIAQSDDQLIVQWQTDELSTSEVGFGLSGTLDMSASDPNPVTLHQVTLTNLTPNTVYDYQVSSTDPNNNGPASSAQVSAATAASSDTTPPVIDDASIGAAPSNDRAIVTWTTDEGATSEIRYGTNADSLNLSLIDQGITTDHSVTITGLASNTTYFYQVLSTDAADNGPVPSATKTFSTTAQADDAPPAISNVGAQALAKADGTVSITFTWTTDKVSTRFVDLDTLSDLSTQQTIGDNAGQTSHSVTVTGLKLDTQYFYRVGSANVNDTNVPPMTTLSPASGGAPATITTPAAADAAPPAPPSTLTAIPGDGAVLLRWSSSTDASGIAGYDVKRDGTALVSNVGDTMFVDNTAANGNAVTYTVLAIDGAGNTGTASAPSAPVTPGTTKVPTKPVSAATPDSVSLKPVLIVGNATPVAGDASRATLTYQFQVAVDSLFSAVIASQQGVSQGTPSNPTHWQVLDPGQPDSTALDNGVTYWWRARANDGAFSGPWSASQVFVASAARPTSVTLASIVAEDDQGVVTLRWKVARTDEAIAGFHVLRSQNPAGGFVRLTDHLVTGDFDFEFVDTDVAVGQAYYYLLESVSLTGVTERFGPVNLRVNAPRAFALRQNYPNPFNPATTIRFDLPDPATVTLVVYNILGQEVIRLLDNEAMAAGFHRVRWSGRNGEGRTAATGVYIYRIQAGKFSKAKKMLLVK